VSSKALSGILAVALMLALPLLGADDYYLHLLIMGGIFFLLSAGMNLLLAAGQLNLGHTAFYAAGGYLCALTVKKRALTFSLHSSWSSSNSVSRFACWGIPLVISLKL